MNIISQKRGPSRHQWMSIHVVLLCAIIIIGWFLTNYLGDRARREIIEDNEATSLLLSTHLTSELTKIEGVVRALAGSPWITPVLYNRNDREIEKANSVLDRYNKSIDASVSYLMDINGTTIASSNRNDPDSFVGKSYQFRPYFAEAIKGNAGRYFALGITSLRKGYYTSYPVKGRDGDIIGVVVMKKDIDYIEGQLRNYPYWFLVDKNGVIFLSSNRDMSLKGLWPIDPENEKKLLSSKQFGEKPFEAVVQKEIEDRTEVTFRGNTFLASRTAINPEGWSIVLMTSMNRITIYKSIGMILTLIACLLIIIPLTFTYQTVRSAEAIHKSEERFQQVAQSSQDWIWETDRDGRYTYSSQAVKYILDYEPDEIIGKHYYDLFVPEERGALTQTFRGFFDRRESFFRVMNKRAHRCGHEVFVESTGVPLFDAKGNIVGYRGTNRDITERKKAEEALSESETRYRTIFETTGSAMMIIEEDTTISLINTEFEKMTGYSKEELEGKRSWTEFVLEEDLPRMKEYHRLRRIDPNAVPTNYEFRLIDKEGRIRDAYLAVTIQPGTNRSVASILDITDRKKAEEALRFTQFSVDHISDSIFWITRDAHFFNVNAAACRKLVYTRDEMLSLTVHDIHPAFTHDVWETHWEELKKFGSVTLESTHRRKDGTFYPVEINANFLEVEGKEYNVAFIRDITERKKAEEEKEKLEKGLIQAQKMEAIGTLAGGIAHDFNNLLMGIQGYASLMLLGTDKNHPNYHRLKTIVDQAKSGADLTAQLLGFARAGRYEIRSINLNEIVKSTLTMFGRTKKEVLIHQKYQEDLWPVEVDGGQIEQVLLNLYVNAWQAMPEGGDLTLETENVILDEGYVKHFSVISGKYVKISVTDTGSGMDKKTQERIFEPFFTTKEMGRGTGLGLATVYGIIKGHRGIINVYSEIGQGTTFTIYLPASEKEVTQERLAPEELVKGHETILIIDDEDIIIEVTRDILESLDYKILVAQSGREAIEIYTAHKDEIALVILDMIMPDMSGGETFDRLKKINPDIKVILSSGYSLKGQAIRIMEKGCYAFIQKPFSFTSLSQKIRDILNGNM
ncbi:MAG: PAS domain S-box protein [Syntrophaceae bacterium]